MPTEHAPTADRFPSYPVSWYWFGSLKELRRGPISRDLFGTRLVAFRTESGRLAVLDARCSHLGSDLADGHVIGEAIRCPFHHWEYGPDGRCTRIPITTCIPNTARQRSYPVVERHGFLFVFNGRQPGFELPFFPGVDVGELTPTRPFSTVLTCPWYMVGANAFDLQHFRTAHDRRLASKPSVACPAPFARHASARFEVVGSCFQDRLTRWFAGNEVEMSITDWCGNLMFVTARFRRTCSYGMITTEPLSSQTVRVRVTVFVPCGQHPLWRRLVDPLHGWIRRLFVMQFLRADVPRLNACRYNPYGLIPQDRELVEYFCWLVHVSHGVPLARAWPEDRTKESSLEFKEIHA